MDDPYLIPTSIGKKRLYSLAREAGKKAALWIRQEHADLLQAHISDPLIPVCQTLKMQNTVL